MFHANYRHIKLMGKDIKHSDGHVGLCSIVLKDHDPSLSVSLNQNMGLKMNLASKYYILQGIRV